MKFEIVVDGIVYVMKDDVAKTDMSIVRTYSAGVFAGCIEKRTNDEVKFKSCRRIWYWSGANSLSQLAIDGTSNPNGCKFSIVTRNHIVLGVIEIIPCTAKALKSIEGVPEWKK